MERFRNRVEAGRKLARALAERRLKLARGIVLAIPRGGVVVGAEVARALGLPFDVLVTKKIGAPANPEYAIGAIGPDGTVVLTDEARQFYRPDELAPIIAEAQAKVTRQIRQFRGDRPLDLKAKSVILVDDGLATGRTAELALRWLKNQQPAQIILAVPVAPPDTLDRLRPLAHDAVVLLVPPYLGAIGEFYDDFTQVEDDEVRRILTTWHTK